MPVQFCPHCEKLLKKRKVGDKWVNACTSCDYQVDIVPDTPPIKKINKESLEKKRAETKTIVINEAERLKLVPESKNILCFRCKSHKIEYMQLQTRRADEPMTTFFRCANCGNRWRG
jgi:transcription factor S